MQPRESWTDEETDSLSVTESTFFPYVNPYTYFELANGHFFEFGRPVGTKMVTLCIKFVGEWRWPSSSLHEASE